MTIDEVIEKEGSENVENTPIEENVSRETLGGTIEKLMEFLTAETGEGSIDEYLEHPLNFKKSKGRAQTLRGATGLFGNLKKAIIDVILGLISEMKEGKNNG